MLFSPIVGRPMAPTEAPWFWSDQYTTKLQIVGVAKPTDMTIVRPTACGTGLTVLHLRDKLLRAAETVNSARDHLLAKRAIGAKRIVEPSALADSQTPLAELLT